MSLVLNLTDAEVAYTIAMGTDGSWQAIAVVKVVHAWDDRGQLSSTQATPILTADEFAGDAATSGLLRARELAPLKPRVDVLLAGALVFPTPITETSIELAVGSRLSKRAKVFGDRVWLPGIVTDLLPSDPRPIARVAIAWERSYGGADESRNPVGSGVAKDPASLHGMPAPNFETTDKAIGSFIGKPQPIGFGPVAAHWQQRVELAGTYDEAWMKTRRPLPPEDFSPAFFNVAPVDQQLDRYLPGEDLLLLNMSPTGTVRFSLPSVDIPVTFVASDTLTEDHARVDTVIIEPEERRVSILAKAQVVLPEGPESLGRIVVGEMSAAIRDAVETGREIPGDVRGTSR